MNPIIRHSKKLWQNYGDSKTISGCQEFGEGWVGGDHGVYRTVELCCVIL